MRRQEVCPDRPQIHTKRDNEMHSPCQGLWVQGEEATHANASFKALITTSSHHNTIHVTISPHEVAARASACDALQKLAQPRREGRETMTSEHTHHRRVPQNSDAPLAGRCLVRHCDWSCYSRKSIPGDNSIRARSRTPKTSHPPCVCSSVFCDDPSLTLSGSNFAWSEKSLYYTYKSFFILY